jgi:sulfotransferase family protein
MQSGEDLPTNSPIPGVAGVFGDPRAVDYSGHNLVFVVGAPRSGTTWLQQLLAAHPRIRTGQESKLFRWYIAPQLRKWTMETRRELNSTTASGRGGTGLSCYFREEEFVSLLKRYLFALLQPMIGSLQDGELFVEKTPSHALCIPEIKRLLPASRIIHIVRDPRDVVTSVLAASRTWGAAWAPEGATDAAGLWAGHVRSVREAAQKLSASEFHEITYEDLSRAPEETLGGIARFLQLDWNQAAIRQAVHDNRPSSAQTTPIPLYGEVAQRVGPVVREPEGFVRTARVGAWRSELSFVQTLAVWRVCRRLMEDVGYSFSSGDLLWKLAGRIPSTADDDDRKRRMAKRAPQPEPSP